MTPAQRANFDRLLAPRQIAFVGGTDAIVAIGEARRRGFEGKYLAVNPERSALAGIPCVPTIADLPEPPDAVFLAIPAASVPDAVAELAAMGAGGVVCYSAGFKEAGATGAALEDALRAAAGEMAVIGPNCYGILNFMDRSALWPFAHGGFCPGYGAAIVTQSGMFSSDITMSQRSLPIAYMVSGGNQAVLGVEDYLEAFAAKPGVRAIGLHIEGLRDLATFERAALEACRRGVPVVALKTGSSEIGSALTITHTGSLSGRRDLYDALFRRLGIIQVTSPAQFLETLKYLCVAGVPAGRRVAGFTCSGGGATMMADHGAVIGLDFPAFAPGQGKALRRLLPDIATVSNPLDYTTPIWGQPERTGPVFAAAMAREDVDAALLIQDYPAAGLDESKAFYRNDADVFAAAARAKGLPTAVCATIPENMDAETRARLIAQGVAPMQGIHEALNAIRDAADWQAGRTAILEAPPPPLCPGAPPADPRAVDEAAGKTWLSAHGLPVPENRVVDGRAAPGAAAEIGFPVALKLVSPALHHKTEAGAVCLGLRDEAEVAAAVADIRTAVSAHDAGALTDRFLVEAMAPAPLAELLVDIRSDPDFGFAMTLGSGGILAELVGDVATVLLPFSMSEIARALRSLRAARLLEGFRGREAADLDALARALAGLADAVMTNRTHVRGIEINPLFVYRDRVLAIDALMQIARGPDATVQQLDNGGAPRGAPAGMPMAIQGGP